MKKGLPAHIHRQRGGGLCCSRTGLAGLAARSLGTCARLAGKDLCPIACDIFSHQRAIDYFLACAALNRMLCLAAKGRLYG